MTGPVAERTRPVTWARRSFATSDNQAGVGPAGLNPQSKGGQQTRLASQMRGGNEGTRVGMNR
jgi:hypothetical protein